MLVNSLAAQPPKKASPPPAPITPLGTEVFRAILAQLGMKPLRSLEDLKTDPKHTVLIAFRGAEARGKPEPLDNVPNGLRQFVEKGGAVLVATDERTEGQWARAFGVEVNGAKIRATDDTGHEKCYKRNPVCPYLEEANAGQTPDLFHVSPQMQANLPSQRRERTQLTEVATNRPSFLRPAASWTRLAKISTPCRVLVPIGQKEPPPLQGPLIIAQSQYDNNSHGKILVIADHSIFINEMLLPVAGQGENDNLAFTLNTLDWLIAGPDGTRNRVLFIDQTGDIKTDFTSLLQQLPPPIPSLDNLPEFLQFLWDNRDKASTVVAAMEQSGVFQEIEGHMDEFVLNHIDFWYIMRALLVLGMIAILVVSCRRMLASRFRFAKAAPRLSLALNRFRPRGSMLDQRLRGSLRGGQCYEAARIRARQLFADVEWTPALEGVPSPKVEINTGWWQRRAIRRDLLELWKIAFGAEPVLVQAKHWDKWLARLREIHKLIRDGVIRVT
jgi:hypothetical protein